MMDRTVCPASLSGRTCHMLSMCGGWTASGTTTIGSNMSGEHVLSIALLILGIVFHHRFYDVFNKTILIYMRNITASSVTILRIL